MRYSKLKQHVIISSLLFNDDVLMLPTFLRPTFLHEVIATCRLTSSTRMRCARRIQHVHCDHEHMLQTCHNCQLSVERPGFL